MHDSVRGLWRALAPTALRGAVGDFLNPIALEYTLRAAVATKGRIGAGPPALVGFFDGASGISRSVQLASRALDSLGIEHRRIEVKDLVAPNEPGDPSASAWMFYLNPPELIWLLYRWNPRRLRGPRYGYWAWELPDAPRGWLRAASAMDGVIAPSRYTANALRGSPTPVTASPSPLIAEDFAGIGRRAMRGMDEPFRVVSLFDYKSSLARKNPFGAIDAFCQAFGPDPSARLLFKTHNSQAFPDLADALRARAGPNVEFIDAIWDHSEVMAFIASADALISLHRAEGFGLTLAEAMMVGAPVVATGWSGNLDFMDDDNACLVPAVLSPVVDEQNIYSNQSWAEPDVAAAAKFLRRLRDDPDKARAMANRAKKAVLDRLNATAWFETLPPGLRLTLSNTSARPER